MEFLTSLLLWIDSEPSRYWTIAWSCMIFLIGLSLVREGPWLLPRATPSPEARWWRILISRRLYVAAVVLTFVAFRWPTWFAGPMHNPDEAQMIAGAITLTYDPVFWRSVDGTTHGPLDDYVLIVPRLLGLKIDFFSARLMGAALHCLCLLCVWFIAGRLLSESAARIGLIPAIGQWGTTAFGDFVQYNSEMMPIALIAGGAAVGVAALDREKPARRRRVQLILAGVLLGSVPYAKLQGVPLAGGVTLLLFARLFVRWQKSARKESWQDAGVLVAGGLFPTLFTAAMLLIYGLVSQFWYAYIESNLLYASEGGFSWRWVYERWFEIMHTAAGFPATFIGHVIVFAVLGLLCLLGSARTRWTVLAGWVVFIGAFLSALAPARPFAHYLQFMVPAMGFLLAGHYQGVKEYLQQSPAANTLSVRWVVVVLLFFATVWPPLYWRKEQGPEFFGSFTRSREAVLSPFAYIVGLRAQPGDRLAIWGWQTNIFVESGLPQGTRDGHTQRLIDPGPLQEFARQRYLRDFQRNRPAWFADTVGGNNFSFSDRGRHAHENFPELATIVANEYTMVADTEGTRIYQRKRP